MNNDFTLLPTSELAALVRKALSQDKLRQPKESTVKFSSCARDYSRLHRILWIEVPTICLVERTGCPHKIKRVCITIMPNNPLIAKHKLRLKIFCRELRALIIDQLQLVGGDSYQRCGMLKPNMAVSFSAASPVMVLRQVRNSASCLPSLSKGRYPCIMALTPMAPTVVRSAPNFALTSAFRLAKQVRMPVCTVSME